MLIGSDANPGGLLVRFTSSQPLVLIRKINLVCPKIIEVTIDGCFNCLTGARFVVKAKSTCSSGFAVGTLITNNNITITSPSIDLNTTEDVDFLPFATPNKFISGTFKLCADTRCDSVLFSAVLNDPTGIAPTPDGNGIIDGSHGKGFNIWDWFKGLTGPWSWAKWIVLTVIIVSVLVVVGFMSYYAYNFYKDYKAEKIEYSSL